MLTIDNLSITFARYGRGLQRAESSPVTDVSLELEAGEILAVVGSSGSGKSLVAHALLGLLPGNAQVGGSIVFKGEQLSAARIRALRGKEIALVPQSITALNPLMRVGSQVYRAARLSGQLQDKARQQTEATFGRYQLDDGVRKMFPFTISGGMARRVLLATATAGDADLLVADEPTTGLDPAVARKSLAHLRELADTGKGVLLITHELDLATTVADRVAVLYGGATVEIVPDPDQFSMGEIRHPYTRALWSALPQNGFRPLVMPQQEEQWAQDGSCPFSCCCKDHDAACNSGDHHLLAVGRSRVRCCHAGR